MLLRAQPLRSTYVPLDVANKMSRRRLRHVPKAVLIDDPGPMVATVSKVVANTVAYPLETCKLLKQTLQHIPWNTPGLLFVGYPQFMMYNAVHSYTYYAIFFAALKHFKESVWLGTLVTSILTCIYKMPVTYYLRNKSANPSTPISWKCCFCWKRYVVLLAEDIPDTFLKFSLNTFFRGIMQQEYMWLVPMVVGVLITVILTPIDHLKTKMFCGHRNKVTHDVTSGLEFRMLGNLMNTTLFVGCLNTLTAIVG